MRLLEAVNLSPTESVHSVLRKYIQKVVEDGSEVCGVKGESRPETDCVLPEPVNLVGDSSRYHTRYIRPQSVS
jgi:hypothetical protein